MADHILLAVKMEYAIRNGDIAALQSIKETPSIIAAAFGTAAASGDSLVWTAACLGHIDILEWLRGNGIDVRGRNNHALRGAARSNQVAVLQWLHDNNLIPRKALPEALRSAAEHGNLAAMEWLHDHGAPITTIDNGRYTWNTTVKNFCQKINAERAATIVNTACNEAIAEARQPPSTTRRALRALGL